MSPTDHDAGSSAAHAFAPSAADLPLLRDRLHQLGRDDLPVLAAPPTSTPDAGHGHAALWSWTAEGIERLGGYAGVCRELDLTLAVGIARWVPLDTLLQVLATGGLTPAAVAAVEVGGRRGLELRLTRGEVAAADLALALLELVTWSAPWHRGRQQPLRLAVAGTTVHDLRDLPHATETRAVWLASPAALRLASPEVVLLGERDATAGDPVAEALRSRHSSLPVGTVSITDDAALRRPTLAAEDLLLAPHGLRPNDGPRSDRGADPAVALLLGLAAGTPLAVPPEVRDQLAPDVVAAAEHPEHGSADPVRRWRASTRLRWAVLREHSAVSLGAALEERTGRPLTQRPRLTLYLDARQDAPSATIAAATRQLAAQRRRPDEVVLLTSQAAATRTGLRTALHRALGLAVSVVPDGRAHAVGGDLVVVMPLDARLAADALADLELVHRLWSPTVSAVPVGFVVDDDGGLYRTEAPRCEGLALPAAGGVLAFAGRELRAHWDAGDGGGLDPDELLREAVSRGGMVHTLPSLRAVFGASPARRKGARHLAVDAELLLAADVP